MKDWQSEFPIDQKSNWKHIREFDLPNTLNITQNEFNKNNHILKSTCTSADKLVPATGTADTGIEFCQRNIMIELHGK